MNSKADANPYEPPPYPLHVRRHVSPTMARLLADWKKKLGISESTKPDNFDCHWF